MLLLLLLQLPIEMMFELVVRRMRSSYTDENNSREPMLIQLQAIACPKSAGCCSASSSSSSSYCTGVIRWKESRSFCRCSLSLQSSSAGTLLPPPQSVSWFQFTIVRNHATAAAVADDDSASTPSLLYPSSRLLRWCFGVTSKCKYVHAGSTSSPPQDLHHSSGKNARDHSPAHNHGT